MKDTEFEAAGATKARLCMYACMYACISACMYACMYACMSVCLHVCLYFCMHVCMHAFMPVCLSVCLSVCMCVCKQASMHVCIEHTCLHTQALLDWLREGNVQGYQCSSNAPTQSKNSTPALFEQAGAIVDAIVGPFRSMLYCVNVCVSLSVSVCLPIYLSLVCVFVT